MGHWVVEVGIDESSKFIHPSCAAQAMGVGFIQKCKWTLPNLSSFCSTSSPPTKHASSFSLAGNVKDTSFELARFSRLYIGTEERDATKSYSCALGVVQGSDYASTLLEERKITVKQSSSQTRGHIISNIDLPIMDDKWSGAATNYVLLMENLEKIEGIFMDSDASMLERDILIQIERLGALELFHACLSKTITAPDSLSMCSSPISLSEEDLENVGGFGTDYIAVWSGKKRERKQRTRRRRMPKPDISNILSPVKEIDKSRSLLLTKSADSLKSQKRRLIIAKNESQMSSGVQDVYNLEKIKTNLEEKLGRAVSFSGWAKAVGVDEKTLKQRLHFGWSCRDKLLRSTRSLVIYLARGYRGRGISFDDLVQAGKLGVLQGADRFDPIRGYRFSTYAQYWIRKCMSTLVARNSRGIQLPPSVKLLVTKVQKARRTLHCKNGRYPCDHEIAKLTGMSLTSVMLARKCSRVPGSLDQKIGKHLHAKFMEVTADTCVRTPEEMAVKQHMITDIHEVLGTLHQRERCVLILRYGLTDGRYKSLEETGQLLNVTKEWVRRIEQAAFLKLQKEETLDRLSPYVEICH